MGVALGSLYGMLQTNKQNMASLDNLGPEFKLGRIISDERLQFDMNPEQNLTTNMTPDQALPASMNPEHTHPAS